MKFIIKFDYRTGDSFHSEERHDEVLTEFEWENLDIAKENLNRIKEHYKWSEDLKTWNMHYYDKKPKPMPPSWWSVKSDWKDSTEHLINLKLDNGNEVQFWPPWIGYFERLHAARINILEDDEMSFEL